MSLLPSPAELGLPPKFDRLFPGQEEAILDVLASPHRFNFLDAPTGAGKSVIYFFTARLFDTAKTRARVLILTKTKGLQDQLMRDFAAAGMVDMRGQANYPCVALGPRGDLADYGRPGGTCDEGPCRVGVFCAKKPTMMERGERGCGYYDAQRSALASHVVVDNYAHWLTLGRHTDPMALGRFDVLVLDEAHTAPDTLAEFCAVELDRLEVRHFLSLELPPIDEGVAVWSAWASGAAKLAKERYIAAKQALELASDRRAATAKLLKLGNLERELSELANAGSWLNTDQARRDARMPGSRIDWVAEHTDHGAKFSPVWGHPYAETLLFRNIPRVILASATLSPVVGKNLGIDPAKSSYHTVKSRFDPKYRPLIYVPTTKVDRHMGEGGTRILVNRVDQIVGGRFDKDGKPIVAGRLDRKGIIHTRSFKLAQEVVRRSRHAGVMLINNSRNTREIVAQFKRSAPPCVLVSPSVEEGFDFPLDQCEYQIILKVPFIDGRSPIVKARQALDRGYGYYVAGLSLVQAYGRGMRLAEDWCETFILDDHWAWFRRATPFQQWFKQAWQEYTSVPAPIKRRAA